MGASFHTAVLAVAMLFCFGSAHAAKLQRAVQPARSTLAVAQPQDVDGIAEARLIEVYTLIGKAQNREALVKATKLVEDLPNFQLAQLVYGDLLAARTRPVKTMGDVPEDVVRSASSAGSALSELREESVLRTRALRERPVDGFIPSQI